MNRNDIFRRRLERHIKVRHDHDVGRCVGFDIIMQQIFARLCCKDAADKTVVLLNLSCMRLENTSLSSTHGGSARSHFRDTVNGSPCRLQHADAPINSVRQLSLMAKRNTIRLECKLGQHEIMFAVYLLCVQARDCSRSNQTMGCAHTWM